MKKIMMGSLFLLAAFVMLGEAKVNVGISGGYVMTSERNYGNGLAFGMNFSLELTRGIALELSGVKFQCPVQASPEGLSQGSLAVMPVMLSLQTRFPVDSEKYIPYIVLGGGYYLNHFSLDSDITKQWEAAGFTIEEKVENVFGIHFGVGIEISLNSKIALNFDVRYGYARSKGSRTLFNILSREREYRSLEAFNLDSILVSVGSKFYW